MAAGTVKLNLKGTVPTSAPYGTKQLLDVIDVAINTTQAGLDDDRVHVVAYIGDASGNALYQTGDVNKIAQVAGGADSGFSAYRNVDPRLIADVNGDGAVNSIDQGIVAAEVQFLSPVGGTDQLQIPPLPGVVTIQFSGPDPLVAMPSLAARAGQTLIVPVYLDTAQDLESEQLSLGYDPDPNSKLRIPVSAASTKAIIR